MQTDEMAKRALQANVQSTDDSNNVALNPEHFTLYCVGTFNDETAELEMLLAPRLLVSAIAYKAPKDVELKAKLDALSKQVSFLCSQYDYISPDEVTESDLQLNGGEL